MKEKILCPSCSQSVEWLETVKANMRICPNCRAMIIDLFIIQIIRTPAGPAPEWVRKSWVDLRVLAEPFDGPEVDFTNGQKVERGKSYAVPKDMALDVLSNTSLEAVQWFIVNFPKHMEYLTFAIDEAEIVEKLSLIAPESFIKGIEVH